MIGQASAAISFSDVPLFSASTANGDIYLEPGGGVDSTAVDVSAGGMNGMANNVSVTSQADFLTIENIIATGEAAVAMNSGSVIEYGKPRPDHRPDRFLDEPVQHRNCLVSLRDRRHERANRGRDCHLAEFRGHLRRERCHFLSYVCRGQYLRRQRDDPVRLPAAYAAASRSHNSVLSETGDADVTFANTDDQDGSAGNVVVSGTVHVSSISGRHQCQWHCRRRTNPDELIRCDHRGRGHGRPERGQRHRHFGNFSRHRGRRDPGCDDEYWRHLYPNGTATGSTLTLSASTSTGDIDVTWNGDIDLSSETSSTTGVVLDSISATGTVTLDAVGGAIVDEYGSTVSANTLVLTATNGIGTASNPLEISSPGTLTLTAAAGDGLFLDSNTALTVDSATAGNGDLSISAAGNLTLQGNVSGTANATLTATAGTLTATAGTLAATAGTLTITAEQIGSTSRRDSNQCNNHERHGELRRHLPQ